MHRFSQKTPKRIKKLAEMALRAERVFGLYLDGLTFAQIGRQLGVVQSVARLDVERALKLLGPSRDDVAAVREQEVDRCNAELARLLQGGLRLRQSAARIQQSRGDEKSLDLDAESMLIDIEQKIGQLSQRRVAWAKRKAELLGLDEPVVTEHKGSPLVQVNAVEQMNVLDAPREARRLMMSIFGEDVRAGDAEVRAEESPAKPGGEVPPDRAAGD